MSGLEVSPKTTCSSPFFLAALSEREPHVPRYFICLLCLVEPLFFSEDTLVNPDTSWKCFFPLLILAQTWLSLSHCSCLQTEITFFYSSWTIGSGPLHVLVSLSREPFLDLFTKWTPIHPLRLSLIDAEKGQNSPFIYDKNSPESGCRGNILQHNKGHIG